MVCMRPQAGARMPTFFFFILEAPETNVDELLERANA
jgi:hypothetical protein